MTEMAVYDEAQVKLTLSSVKLKVSSRSRSSTRVQDGLLTMLTRQSDLTIKNRKKRNTEKAAANLQSLLGLNVVLSVAERASSFVYV